MSSPTRKEYVMVAIGEGDDGKVQEEREGEEKNVKVNQIGYDELLKRKKEMFEPDPISEDDSDNDESSFYKRSEKKRTTVMEVPSRENYNRGGWCQDFTRALTGGQ